MTRDETLDLYSLVVIWFITEGENIRKRLTYEIPGAGEGYPSKPSYRIWVDKSMQEIGTILLARERRKHPRFELTQPLAYRWDMIKATFRTVDLSMGGIRIHTNSPMAVGERLNLIMLLQYGVIKPRGKVVWSNLSWNRKYDIGICFETISHQCLQRLTRFLEGTTLRNKLAQGEKALDQSG